MKKIIYNSLFISTLLTLNSSISLAQEPVSEIMNLHKHIEESSSNEEIILFDNKSEPISEFYSNELSPSNPIFEDKENTSINKIDKNHELNKRNMLNNQRELSTTFDQHMTNI